MLLVKACSKITREVSLSRYSCLRMNTFSWKFDLKTIWMVVEAAGGQERVSGASARVRYLAGTSPPK